LRFGANDETFDDNVRPLSRRPNVAETVTPSTAPSRFLDSGVDAELFKR